MHPLAVIIDLYTQAATGKRMIGIAAHIDAGKTTTTINLAAATSSAIAAGLAIVLAFGCTDQPTLSRRSTEEVTS